MIRSKVKSKDILENTSIKTMMLDDRVDIYNNIAWLMAKKLFENNQKGLQTSFILPVGPRGQYRRFAQICNENDISCRDLITINMDEYLDENNHYIPEENVLSFRRFMKVEFLNLLKKEIKIKPENMNFPDPDNPGAIGRIIDQLDGVDICFGGVGINGHIAFNEPVSDKNISINEFGSLKTRVVNISEETIAINSMRYGGNIEAIPKKGITIGMYEIFKSKELRFYLEDDWKAMALYKIIFSKVSSSFPASYLKEHHNSTLVFSKNVLSNIDFIDI